MTANSNTLRMSAYGRRTTGNKYSAQYQVYVTLEDKIISPFHDIPVYADQDHINVVNEIPRFENAKFEINKEKKMNPIMQDVKNGKPRYVANIFPCRGYPWNYGAIPQTWEDPSVKNTNTNCFGDDDPLDVIEVGNVTKEVGEVYVAKIIGCIGLIDSGECDWKIIVIDKRDENAKHVNDVNDLKSTFPGLQNVTYNWFMNYKLADNKPKNSFLDYGELKSKEFAKNIIKECHENWKRLMKIELETSISRVNALQKEHRSVEEIVISDSEGSVEAVPDSLNGYFYVKEE
ncbi:Inorganic pyrophosphatase/Nucleosome remodeling factor, subunit NURF38 [Trachipleistophora hominis]|uniref:inorganic diphosphatase n=1 Tax=Trachipleistophora hominis TaxID=72359 RepID=L7JT90_TRAHO|nr:Inorganic pyrophosphatase/Nucleosome remodeling factor, subunit NURF38 [Trachipleistophora hominis]